MPCFVFLILVNGDDCGCCVVWCGEGWGGGGSRLLKRMQVGVFWGWIQLRLGGFVVTLVVTWLIVVTVGWYVVVFWVSAALRVWGEARWGLVWILDMIYVVSVMDWLMDRVLAVDLWQSCLLSRLWCKYNRRWGGLAAVNVVVVFTFCSWKSLLQLWSSFSLRGNELEELYMVTFMSVFCGFWNWLHLTCFVAMPTECWFS